MTDTTVRILALAGSLRRASYNRALVGAAARLDLPGIKVTVYDDLGSVPAFNADLEDEALLPDGVRRIREAIAISDGLLISTPAYNQAVPGVLKNLIDWLSRSPSGQGLEGLPVAVTGATPGPWGTRIAQTMLRQMLVSTEALLLPSPKLYLRDAKSLFDGSLNLVDPETRERLAALVVALAAWVRRLRPCAEPGPER